MCLFQWDGVGNSISLSSRKWVNCQTTEITIVDSDSGIRSEEESCRGTLGLGLIVILPAMAGERRLSANLSGPQTLDGLFSVGCVVAGYIRQWVQLAVS